MRKFKCDFDELASSMEFKNIIGDIGDINTYILKNIRVYKLKIFFLRIKVIIRNIIYNNPIMVFLYNIGYYNNYKLYMKIIDYLNDLCNVICSINEIRLNLLDHYDKENLSLEEVVKFNYLSNKVYINTNDYINKLISAKKRELRYKGMHMSVPVSNDSNYTMDEFYEFYLDFINNKKIDK